MHDAGELGGSGLANDGGIDEEREQVDSPVLGAEASGIGTREPGDAGVKLGNGAVPCSASHTFPSVVGPLCPDALQECGSDPERDPQVGSTGGNDFRAERREGKGGGPELDAGGRNDGSLDRAGAWDADNGRAGSPVRTESCSKDGKREVSRDADSGVQAGVGASLADCNREGMQDTSCAIAQVPSSEPRTFVDIGDKSGGFSGRKKKEEEAHDLHGANSESTEIIDIGRTRDAKSNREPSDERIVSEIPQERRSRASHAETTLEKPQDAVLAADDGSDPLLRMRQRNAQIAQEGICHPRMTRMRHGRLSRSKALLWSPDHRTA